MSKQGSPQNGKVVDAESVIAQVTHTGELEQRIVERIAELKGHLEQLAGQEANLRAGLEQTVLQIAATRGAIGELEEALHPKPRPTPAAPADAPKEE